MSWYKEGTVNIEQGSKTVTGIGTKWANPLIGVCAGQMLILKTSNTIEIYEIASVQSDTQLTLANQYSGASKTGVSYEIPTTPKVSIEALALRISEMLNYYQQQMNGWQSILTGTGDITLTAPDGRIVTIKSQTSISNELIKLVDDSKGFSESASQSATNADSSAQSALNSSNDATESAKSASQSASEANTSAQQSADSAQTASQSATKASESAQTAQSYASNAETSANNAAQSATEAKNAIESIGTSIDTSNFIKKSGEENQSIDGSLNVDELTENGVRVYSPNNKPKADDVGALAVTKTEVDGEPIYMVGENVNHVGKFTVNDKTVLTEDDKFKIESMILYPGGDESTPARIYNNQRIIIDNPFNTNLVLAWVEFLENDVWYKHDEIIFNGSTGYGAKTNQIGDKIVIQTGNSAVKTRYFHDGNPTGINNILTSLPYRLVIVKIGD